MKLAAFLLLLVGWFLVVAAVVLLKVAGPRNAFVAAGVAVELLGFGLAFKAHLAPEPGRN
jgi:hypothetical protein